MKEKIYSFDEYEGTDDMVRLRFKVWRQAHGLTRGDLKERITEGVAFYKFERPGGNSPLKTIYRMIHQLRVDPGFLMTGSYTTVMPATRQCLEALLSQGRTLTDKEAAQCLSNNGLEPIRSSLDND